LQRYPPPRAGSAARAGVQTKPTDVILPTAPVTKEEAEAADESVSVVRAQRAEEMRTMRANTIRSDQPAKDRRAKLAGPKGTTRRDVDPVSFTMRFVGSALEIESEGDDSLTDSAD
jgi:hypothetical protein